MTNPVAEPPEILSKYEADFSVNLRAHTTWGNHISRGLCIYREIIRDNIRSVMNNVFPVLCSNLDDVNINRLVDLFIHDHDAGQPEFHQIATELLIFLRQQDILLLNKNALIEYEWLMYALEIDDSEVPKTQRITLRADRIDNIYAVRNPTLKIVSLPFCINGVEIIYDHQNIIHYYALFRKHDHTIWQKKLNQREVLFLSGMSRASVPINLLAKDAESISPATSILSWIESFQNDEILLFTLRI